MVTEYAKDVLRRRYKREVGLDLPEEAIAGYAEQVRRGLAVVPPIEEPPIRPPVEPFIEPPVAPPIEALLPIEPIDIIERVYPKYPSYKPEEIPAQVAELSAWAEEDPEAFLYDLQARASEEDAKGVLGLLGATEEDIEAIYAEPTPFEIPPEGYQFVEEVEEPVEPYIREVEEEGVIVRNMVCYDLPGFIRVTVGLEAENKNFIEKLQNVVHNSPNF